MPKATRIVKLGSDMISLDSEIAQIPTYYAFEASELNYINGKYVYTYNTSWAERTVHRDLMRYNILKSVNSAKKPCSISDWAIPIITPICTSTRVSGISYIILLLCRKGLIPAEDSGVCA